MNRILLTAMLCFLVVSSASADIKAKDKSPATATVAVNCNLGERITDALVVPAVALTIEISGICEEDVHVLRSNVTLRGTDPSMDGIRPALDDVLNQALNLFGVNTILIENLKITGGRMGIGINYSFGVTLRNCLIEENDFAGVIAGTASGSIVLEDTVIRNNGTRGIWVTNGSNLICRRCTIENHSTAIKLSNSSKMFFIGSTAQNAFRGVDVSGGSHFATFAPKSAIDGNRAIQLNDHASARIQAGDTLNGEIRISGHSVAILRNSTQSNASLFNYVDSGSSLAARGTSLEGDIFVSEFADVTLHFGSTISGGLYCRLGADAACDDPLGATGYSDCGQCPNP